MNNKYSYNYDLCSYYSLSNFMEICAFARNIVKLLYKYIRISNFNGMPQDGSYYLWDCTVNSSY